MKKTIIASVIAIGASLTAVPAANATVYGWRWASNDVTIYNSTKSKAITEALNNWKGANPNLNVTVTTRPCSNCITVAWGDTDRNNDGVEEAWGYAYFNVNSGVVDSCRADVSTSLKKGGRDSNNRYAPAVAMHEVGHCLGLDHTTETMNSLMTPSILNPDLLSPTAYDKADLNTLYG